MQKLSCKNGMAFSHRVFVYELVHKFVLWGLLQIDAHHKEKRSAQRRRTTLRDAAAENFYLAGLVGKVSIPTNETKAFLE